jgi:hypothetical protein
MESRGLHKLGQMDGLLIVLAELHKRGQMIGFLIILAELVSAKIYLGTSIVSHPEFPFPSPSQGSPSIWHQH